MKSFIIKSIIFVTGAVFLWVVLTLTVLAKKPVNTNWRGLALGGYDAVSYFTDGKPVKGSGDFEFKWRGAKWRFGSAEHLNTFKADPEKYAPQYGGYCAWAVAQGDTADIDPKIWKIVNGRLYLNYDAEIQAKWEKDIPGFISKADQYWPGVLK